MEESPSVKIIRIILIILAIILFVSFVIWIFRPRTPDTVEETVAPATVQYPAVRFVQEGRIVAPEDHNSIVITITSSSRRIEVYRGYDVGPKRSESFPNNQASYDRFYASLKSSGFFASRDNRNNLDRNGFCPLGTRFDYQAGNDISTPTQNTWGASCGGQSGTFAGKAGTVRTLFIRQIPEYNKFIQGVTL